MSSSIPLLELSASVPVHLPSDMGQLLSMHGMVRRSTPLPAPACQHPPACTCLHPPACTCLPACRCLTIGLQVGGPEPPVITKCQATGGSVIIHWQPPTWSGSERAVASYQAQRAVGNSQFEPVLHSTVQHIESKHELSIQDRAVSQLAGLLVRYRVRGVDSAQVAGNWSAPTQIQVPSQCERIGIPTPIALIDMPESPPRTSFMSHQQSRTAPPTDHWSDSRTDPKGVDIRTDPKASTANKVPNPSTDRYQT